MLEQLRKQGWPVVAMDGGGQERDADAQSLLKLDFAYRALIKMGYQAVGLGEGDLKNDLISIAINLDEGKNPLVSANVDTGFSKPFKVITAGGMKIGVTSVLGAKEITRCANLNNYKFLPPTQAIPQVVPELLKAKCDHLVLMVNGSDQEAKDLAVKYKDFGFDWILTTQMRRSSAEGTGKRSKERRLT